jgi:hypothetical protein
LPPERLISSENAKPRAAVLLRDERGQIPGVGQGLDEGLGVGALLVQLAPVDVRVLLTQLAHIAADRLLFFGEGEWLGECSGHRICPLEGRKQKDEG